MSVAPAEVEREEAAARCRCPTRRGSPSSGTTRSTSCPTSPTCSRSVFGYAEPKAEKLMLDVHHRGKAVVSNGTREAMEKDAEILHGYGLWATVSHDR